MILANLLRDKGNEIYKINAEKSIADAAKVLVEKKIGAVLVEDGAGNIVGILSERDIMAGLPPHGADLHNVAVSELMTSDIIKCAPGDTVSQGLAMMTDRRIRHLPVFDEDGLVGILSVGDLVKSMISEVQAEADAMRQYISM